jgi:hypothetical protein
MERRKENFMVDSVPCQRSPRIPPSENLSVGRSDVIPGFRLFEWFAAISEILLFKMVFLSAEPEGDNGL